jgi:alkylation response protein AidB-like acyl-CoA dehydrogenase
MFGGIGITWEHDIHLFMRHATTLTSRLGPPKFHRAVIMGDLKRAASDG